MSGWAALQEARSLCSCTRRGVNHHSSFVLIPINVVEVFILSCQIQELVGQQERKDQIRKAGQVLAEKKGGLSTGIIAEQGLDSYLKSDGKK